MKKKFIHGSFFYEESKKRFLVMKQFLVLMLFFTVSGFASSFAQDQLITIDLKEASYYDVLNEVKKQAGLDFMYTSELGKLPPIEISVKEKKLGDFLDELFSATGLSYLIENNMLILKKKDIAQDIKKITVNGTVKDERGEPLPGVTIRIKNTNAGFASNVNGEFNFELPVGENHVLIFSFVGFVTQEVKVVEGKAINIVLVEDVKSLGEVVVTGKFDLNPGTTTSSITTITQEEIRQNYSRNLLQTLSTLEPSFRIIQNNAQGSNPNALPEIQLRGVTTLVGPGALNLVGQRAIVNQPLFILDGFEVDLERVVDLNDYEIERIDILKDANATSLYGSKGANGVVVITTAKPKEGRLLITYSGEAKFEIPDLSTYNLMNAKEKLELEEYLGYWEMFPEEYSVIKEKVDGGMNTDWLSFPTRTAVGQSHVLNATGGNENWRINLNLRYQVIAGIMKGSDRKLFNSTLAINYTKDNYIFSNSISVNTTNTNVTPYGEFYTYVNLNPYWEPYDEESTGNWRFFHPAIQGSNKYIENPMYNSTLNWWDKSHNMSLSNNSSFTYNYKNIFRGTVNFGISKTYGGSDNFIPPSHKRFDGEDVTLKGIYIKSTNEIYKWQWGVTLNYNQIFNDVHSVTGGLSFDMEEKFTDTNSTEGRGFISDNMDHFSNAMSYPVNGVPSGSEEKSRRLGIVGFVNYTYDMRYHLDGTYRLDGSSSFGENSRFAPFFSYGLGWTASNERFIRENISLINSLRFKYTYGVSGSVNFSPDKAMSVYNIMTTDYYQGGVGAYLQSFGNPDLKWQNTYTHNFGIDFSFFKEIFTTRFNYYKKTTRNTVSELYLPPTHGYDTYTANVGTIQNKGWEFSTTMKVIDDNENRLRLNITVNFAQNKEKVTKLSQAFLDQFTISSSSSDIYYTYREGYSTKALYGYRSAGINPADGRRAYYDKEGNITYAITATDLLDQAYLGDREPKVNGGTHLNFMYKGLRLNLNFTFKWGGKEFNQTAINRIENAQFYQNSDKDVLKQRWQKPGDQALFKGLKINDGTMANDAFVHKDNVFQFAALNIGYDLPNRWYRNIGIQRISVETQFSDLFYLSTIKRERGTSYPFSKNPNFSITCSF